MMRRTHFRALYNGGGNRQVLPCPSFITTAGTTGVLVNKSTCGTTSRCPVDVYMYICYVFNWISRTVHVAHFATFTSTSNTCMGYNILNNVFVSPRTRKICAIHCRNCVCLCVLCMYPMLCSKCRCRLPSLLSLSSPSSSVADNSPIFKHSYTKKMIAVLASARDV